MKKRIILIGFLLWTVFAVERLQGHGVLGQVVQHHIIVTAGEFHIDVTVELTFHSVFAQRERQRLDTNRDGFIEAKEVEQYLAGILAKLEPGLRMETRQREIDLIRLHPPELDLLGNEESGAHPLRVSAFYLARLDRGLRKAGVVDLEDRLWMEGHALAMNTTSLVRDPDRYYLYGWMFDRVHRQGGLTGYAHVHRTYPQLHRDMSINVPKNKVDFLELMQIGILGTNLYYEFLNLGFKLTAAAGSDMPFAGTVGEVRVYAYAREPADADSWFEAVRQGRTFVTNGPMLELEVGGAMPGGEVLVEKDRKVRVRARTWGHPERSRPSRLEIVRHGQVIRQVHPGHAGEHELRLSFELEAESGYWIAARAEGADGSRAHTTPVYVVRKPLRFWKYDQVEPLITTRLHSLAEVERLVDQATSMSQGQIAYEPLGTGEGTGWWEIQRLAEQGPELLERVAEARRIYEQLRETWKLEKSQREGAR